MGKVYIFRGSPSSGIDSHSHGFAIAKIPEDADEHDFLKGLRDAMETFFTDGYFMVEYSPTDQAKILGGADPNSFQQNTIFFDIEEYKETSGLPDHSF